MVTTTLLLTSILLGLLAPQALLAQTWSPTGGMAFARRDHRATLLGTGKVLIVGWTTGVAELYDPVTRTFSQTGSTMGGSSLPEGRAHRPNLSIRPRGCST
jgi:hypothetical protein